MENQSTLTGKLSGRTLKALLLLTIAGLLSGCGATSKTRDGASSSSTYYGAECNTFDATSVRLQGRAATYYQSGIMQEDKVRLKFTSFDSQFDASSNVIIRMYRWRADATGAVTIDSTPLEFRLETVNGSVLASSLTGLTTDVITKLRANNNISGTTSADFFNSVTAVVSGVDYNWQAMKIVMYNGSTVLGEINFLLPVYTANPNSYAATHTAVLAQLHPFYNQSSQALSDLNWWDRTKSFCF
jgi:hypothetical protein